MVARWNTLYQCIYRCTSRRARGQILSVTSEVQELDRVSPNDSGSIAPRPHIFQFARGPLTACLSRTRSEYEARRQANRSGAMTRLSSKPFITLHHIPHVIIWPHVEDFARFLPSRRSISLSESGQGIYVIVSHSSCTGSRRGCNG